MKAANTCSWTMLLLPAIMTFSGCEQKPVDSTNVSINFILSGRSETVTLAWPVSNAGREAVQTVANRLQDGDKILILISRSGTTRLMEFRAERSDDFRIIRVDEPGGIHVIAAGPNRDTVLQSFAMVLTKYIETALYLLDGRETKRSS